MREIAFRDLAQDDLPALFGWLSRPHVKKWYAPQPSSFAEVAARYGPRTEASSVVKAFIVRSGNEDVGYIQTYPIALFPDYARALACEGGLAGVDLYIGDEWRLGRGLGSEVIRRFVDEVVFGRSGAPACVAGVPEGNAATMRAFEKAGFRRWKSVVNERGEPERVLRIERGHVGYRVRTIDLADAATCVLFRRDMYVASFGTEEGLEDEMGPGNAKYLDDLRAKLAQLPQGNVHLRHGDTIVGQLEMRLVDAEPHLGYVSLLYVLPELRGQGLGKRLHEHAAEVSRQRGKSAMRLSVSLANTPAIMFYRRLGWQMVGSRPNKSPMAIMEFPLR